MTKYQLKKFVKGVLNILYEEKGNPLGISPDKMKQSKCPKCQHPIITLKSTSPVTFGCKKCNYTWENDKLNEIELPSNWNKGFQHPIKIGADGKETPFLKNGQWYIRVWDDKEKKHLIYNYSTDMFEPDEPEKVDEEHGDVHYWGAQPKEKQYNISTGYDGTSPLKESNLRDIVVEAATEVAREYIQQHPQSHEKEEISKFQTIRNLADQLIKMHQQKNYREEDELSLIRQIKRVAMEIESHHTGTKITTNEKVG